MDNKQIINLYKEELKNFFNRPSIQEALENKEFEFIYDCWGTLRHGTIPNSALTALFLESNTNFLNYMYMIPSACFYTLNCSNLNIPEGVELIAANAFQYSNISTITFPKSLRKTGRDCFKDCKFTKAIFKDPKWWQVDNIDIPVDFTDSEYAAELLKVSSHVDKIE